MNSDYNINSNFFLYKNFECFKKKVPECTSGLDFFMFLHFEDPWTNKIHLGRKSKTYSFLQSTNSHENISVSHQKKSKSTPVWAWETLFLLKKRGYLVIHPVKQRFLKKARIKILSYFYLADCPNWLFKQLCPISWLKVDQEIRHFSLG